MVRGAGEAPYRHAICRSGLIRPRPVIGPRPLERDLFYCEAPKCNKLLLASPPENQAAEIAEVILARVGELVRESRVQVVELAGPDVNPLVNWDIKAAARAQEMALRISIGAGRRRLVQLILCQSALLALLASVLGAVFAAWSAPFVLSLINPPDDPARLALPADWRVRLFGFGLIILVVLLLGLLPALRASAVRPVTPRAASAHSTSRGPRIGCARYTRASSRLLIEYFLAVDAKVVLGANRRNPRCALGELEFRAGRVVPEPERHRDHEAREGGDIRDPANGGVVPLVDQQQDKRTRERRVEDEREIMGHLSVAKFI